MTSSIRKNTE